MQQLDQFFAARVEKAVASGPAEALRQHMEHQQVKKIFAGDRSGLILFRLGIEISEGDHAVFVFQDILFLNHPLVEIPAQIDQRLVAPADVLAIHHPFAGSVCRYRQSMGGNGLQDFCPEDLGHGLMVEKILPRLHPPGLVFLVDASPWHHYVDMGMELKPS